MGFAEPDSLVTVSGRQAVLIDCFDEYGGHIQGACTDGTFVYMTQMGWIYKFDRKGKLVRKVETTRHAGDICHHDGLLYLSSIDYQGTRKGCGVIRVYDTDLNLKRERYLEPCGLDGIVYLNGWLYVGGGAHLPTIPKVNGTVRTGTPHLDNNLFKVDPQTLEIVERHVLNHGSNTRCGIQNATTDGKYLYFCYYTWEKTLPDCVVYDENLRLVSTHRVDAGNGFEFLGEKNGVRRFLRLKTENASMNRRKPGDVFRVVIDRVELSSPK